MSSEKNRSESTDARVLRAVAHPVRLDLLDLLRQDGPLTASRCAERLGLTPKVCSYHLTLLGKYGLVEETGDGKGRARPWRLVPTRLSYVHEPGEDPARARAADEFARTMLARDVQRIEHFVERRRELPRRWRNVATMSSNPLRLTPKQLRAFGAELLDVLERYRDVEPDPAARPIHVAIYAVPTEP